MTGLATDALAKAYSVWPSFAGAFLLLSLALAVLVLPLSVRGTRASRITSELQPRTNAIRKAGLSPAAANERVEDLYRSKGTSQAAVATSMFLGLIALVVMLVAFFVLLGIVHRLSEADADARPKGLAPSTALARAVSEQDGLPSLGLDLGKSAATFRGKAAATPYVAASLAVVLLLAIRRRLTAGTWRIGSLWAWLFPYVIAQYLPVAMLVCVGVWVIVVGGGTAVLGRRATKPAIRRQSATRPNPRASFSSASQEARQLDAAGDPERAAAVREDAIRQFFRNAFPGELEKLQGDVERDCMELVVRRPSEAVELYAELARRSALGVSAAAMTAFVTKWISSPAMTAFERDWENIRAAAGGHSPDQVLLDACKSLAPRLPDGFVRQGTGYFLRALDTSVTLSRSGTKARSADTLGFDVLDVLAPGRRPLTRADHYCVLGDMAAGRGDRLEAKLRYEEAARLGSPAADVRVAHSLALEGFELLRARRFDAATKQLNAAVEWCPEPEYEFLRTVAAVLHGDAARDTSRYARVFTGLTSKGVPQPVADYWTAVAYIKAGQADQAATLLASTTGFAPGDGSEWSLGDDALTLRAVLTGDDQTVVDRARQLARIPGSWIDDGPSDPWTLLAATYRSDQDLFLSLMAALPENFDVPPWASTAGAHVSVAQSLALARRGQIGEATAKLELADRLLAR